MDILFIHYAIYILALGVSCLKWEIFMFSSLDLMSENPERVSGLAIFSMTNNISYPSSWVLKVYADLKSLNLSFASVVRELLIHRPSILDLRRL